jgi:Uma2 family endonuclease
MSLIEWPDRKVLPPLEPGQRLDQRTFHERYEAMPPGTWAELIGGVVHMPSPLFDDHGGNGDIVSLLMGLYRRSTPGLRSGASVSTILDDASEVQPDHQLRIRAEYGGRARVVGGYVQGPPELVFEVSRSSKKIDLGSKKREYERAGVLEYVVVELDPDRVHWFRLEGGHYVDHAPGADGTFRSEVFPGLWLDPVAFFADDLDTLIAVLERGLATPEHAAFVARLAAAGRQG